MQFHTNDFAHCHLYGSDLVLRVGGASAKEDFEYQMSELLFKYFH